MPRRRLGPPENQPNPPKKRGRPRKDDRPAVQEIDRLVRFGDAALLDPDYGREEVIRQEDRPLNVQNPYSLSADEIDEIMKGVCVSDLREGTHKKLLEQAHDLMEKWRNGPGPHGPLCQPIRAWIERFYKFFPDTELSRLFNTSDEVIKRFRKSKNLIRTSDDRLGKGAISKQLVRLGRTGVAAKTIDRITEYKKSTRYYKQKEVLTADEWLWFDDQFTEMVADLCEEGDLTRQEINAVIDLCLEYLNQFRLNKRLRVLNQIEAEGVENLEERKLVENSFNNSIDRSQKMLRDLKATRRQRLDKSQPRKLSIVDLVEAWKKDETKGFLLQRAKLAQEELQSEFEKLKDPRIGMAMILGYDPSKRIVDIDEEFGKEED